MAALPLDRSRWEEERETHPEIQERRPRTKKPTLRGLSERQEAVLQRVAAGMAKTAIARELGVTPQAIHNLLVRARKHTDQFRPDPLILPSRPCTTPGCSSRRWDGGLCSECGF